MSKSYVEEIADALVKATNDLGGDPADVRLLAPRIVKAIYAAHDDGVADGWGRSSGPEEPALAALRGEA